MNIVPVIQAITAAAVTASVFLSTSCASQNSSGYGVGYIVEDVPADEEIVLRLVNGTRLNVCISMSDWPDDKGRVSEAQIVALEVGQRSFPLREMGHYDCFDFWDDGSCSHNILPGETLVGRIPYENFSLPASLRYEAKTLRFSPPYTLEDGGCEP